MTCEACGKCEAERFIAAVNSDGGYLICKVCFAKLRVMRLVDARGAILGGWSKRGKGDIYWDMARGAHVTAFQWKERLR